jgi:hypothetical protein
MKRQSASMLFPVKHENIAARRWPVITYHGSQWRAAPRAINTGRGDGRATCALRMVAHYPQSEFRYREIGVVELGESPPILHSSMSAWNSHSASPSTRHPYRRRLTRVRRGSSSYVLSAQKILGAAQTDGTLRLMAERHIPVTPHRIRHGEKLSRVSTNNEPMRWAHKSDGITCTPDEEKTFEHCNRSCAGIRAFRKLEVGSVRWIQ